MGETVVLEYAVKFCLCAVLFCCAGCGECRQAQVRQETPGKPILQTEQSQTRETWSSFVDAYPENWEHELHELALLSK